MKGNNYSTRHVTQNYIDRKNGMKPRPSKYEKGEASLFLFVFGPLFINGVLFNTILQPIANFITVMIGLSGTYYIWFQIVKKMYEQRQEDKNDNSTSDM